MIGINKKRFVFALILFAASCSSVNESKTATGIPIRFASYSDSPLLKINIGGNEYTVKIDLGASCNLMLKQRVLDEIRSEKIEGVSMRYDIQGNEYQHTEYKMPLFKLGHLSIEDAIAVEEDEFFITTGSKPFGAIKREVAKQLKFIDGRIGCSLFYTSVCFFDLSNSSFFVEMSLEGVKKNISLNEYIEAPFDLVKGLVCVDFMTENGKKKFILDTGANLSLVRKSSFSHRGNRLNITQLQLGSKNFGCWGFLSIDFPEKLVGVDGILGMDFFRKFAICLDFQQKKIYIKRSSGFPLFFR